MNVRSAVVNVSATDRKSTRLNSSHTEIYTLSLHDALPIFLQLERIGRDRVPVQRNLVAQRANERALRGRERVGHDEDVGLDAAAAVNRAAGVGVEDRRRIDLGAVQGTLRRDDLRLLLSLAVRDAL